MLFLITKNDKIITKINFPMRTSPLHLAMRSHAAGVTGRTGLECEDFGYRVANGSKNKSLLMIEMRALAS